MNFVLFSSGHASVGLWCSTISVDADGNLALIDQSVLDSCYDDKLIASCRVSGDIWAVAYYRAVSSYYVRTVEISEDGTIVNTDVDHSGSFTFDSNIISMFNRGDGVFVISSYESPKNGTNITTIEIADDGTIGSQLETSSEITTGGQFPLYPISGGIYAGPHYQVDTKGYVTSIDVSTPSGAINEVETNEYLAAGVGVNRPIHVAGDVYAYMKNAGYEIWIYSFSCDASGDISATHIDSLQFPSAYYLASTGIIKVADGVYAVMYRRGSPYSPYYYEIKTFELADDGTFGSVIATQSITEFSPIKLCSGILNTGISTEDGYIIAVAFRTDASPWSSEIRTYAISEDGATITYKDTLDFTGGAFYCYSFSFASLEEAEVDRIQVWLGDEDDPLQVELTDPDYSTVLAVRTERGQDQELQQAQAGIAEITCDNHNGDYSPENESGQYYGDLVLGKWVSVFEIYGGVTYNHFFGRIEKITPHAEHDNQVAYILCQDGMGDLARLEINTQAREDTDAGTVLEDVLDEAGWSATARDIDSGTDTLQLAWFHKMKALDAIRTLERVEGGRFFIDAEGNAVFRNRHSRLTGDGLVSQATFDETMVELAYEWSKNLVYNQVTVRGRRYFLGGVMLTSGYDMAELDDELFYSVHTGDNTAPRISQGGTLTLWAEVGSPIESYTTLVKGTHWNANSDYDKSGTDLSDNITLTQTQYGQSVKLVFENSGEVDAYLVVPDSPPVGAPSDRTVLVYGVLYAEEAVTITSEDTDSQDIYGKRGLDLDIPFKSHPNDIESWSTFLVGKYKDAVPRAVSCRHVARTAWNDDTIRLECLTRDIDDRITVASSKLGIDQDYYINKVIQEYVFLQGGTVHETTWIIERCLGTSEGVFWLLGEAGFGELGETTRLGV